MAKKYSHTCRICGKSYEGCNYCDSQHGKTFMWRQVACSIECAQEYFKQVEEARKSKEEDIKVIEIQHVHDDIEDESQDKQIIDISEDLHLEFRTDKKKRKK